MDDTVELVSGEGALDEHGVADVAFDELDVSEEPGDVAAFDGGVVVVVEVIEDGDFVPVAEERLDEMRADEAGATGDEKMRGRGVGAGRRR